MLCPQLTQGNVAASEGPSLKFVSCLKRFLKPTLSVSFTFSRASENFLTRIGKLAAKILTDKSTIYVWALAKAGNCMESNHWSMSRQSGKHLKECLFPTDLL